MKEVEKVIPEDLEDSKDNYIVLQEADVKRVVETTLIRSRRKARHGDDANTLASSRRHKITEDLEKTENMSLEETGNISFHPIGAIFCPCASISEKDVSKDQPIGRPRCRESKKA